MGPASNKDPLQKDLLRLILLTAEKYRMNVVRAAFHHAAGGLVPHTSTCVGAATATCRSPITATSRGCWPIATASRTHGYFNPVYPAVQDWVADVIGELADRYKDSPAFKGVALRLMAWQFASWQTFPSIHYGYEDYTVQLFEKETGIKVPVAARCGRSLRKALPLADGQRV